MWTGCGKAAVDSDNADENIVNQKDDDIEQEDQNEDSKDTFDSKDTAEKKDEEKQVAAGPFLITDDNSVSIYRDGEIKPVFNLSENEKDYSYIGESALIGDYIYIMKMSNESNSKLYVLNLDGEQLFDFSTEKNASGFKFIEYDKNVYIKYSMYAADYSSKAKVYKYVPGSKSLEYDNEMSDMINLGDSIGYGFPSYSDNYLNAMANCGDTLYGWKYETRQFYKKVYD